MKTQVFSAFLSLCFSASSLLSFEVSPREPAQSSIPDDLMAAVTKARYAVRFETEERIPTASNYAHDLWARFGDEGIDVTLRGKESAGSHALGIRLSRWGRAGVSKRRRGVPSQK